VVAFALEQPACGQLRVSGELKRAGDFGITAEVRTIGVRQDLETFELRLKAASAKSRRRGNPAWRNANQHYRP
jgi:hypothetical protein